MTETIYEQCSSPQEMCTIERRRQYAFPIPAHASSLKSNPPSNGTHIYINIIQKQMVKDRERT